MPLICAISKEEHALDTTIFIWYLQVTVDLKRHFAHSHFLHESASDVIINVFACSKCSCMHVAQGVSLRATKSRGTEIWCTAPSFAKVMHVYIHSD